jgi:hypothetical protein
MAIKGGIIQFEDKNVKQVLLNHDVNKDYDNEISYVEAQAVTRIDSWFTANERIKYFDELGYFTQLELIRLEAFSGCTRLERITIPSSVFGIGKRAFSGCTSLTSVTCNATTPPSLGKNAFVNTNADLTIYVPVGCVEKYQTTLNWNDYAERIEEIGYKPDISDLALTPEGGTYDASQIVTITCETEDVSIYYTIDQSMPSPTNGILYTGPIQIKKTTTLKAIGIKEGYHNSKVASAVYNLNIGQVATPVFNPTGGKYMATENVEITTETDNAIIYYTIDGSEPTENSNIYTEPIAISENTTLKAYGVKDGNNDSDIVTAEYTFTHAIAFKDPLVKQILLDNGVDKDGDGFISEEEAAQVRGLFDWFTGKGITSFDELKYFTKIKYIRANTFANCDKLTSITIPDTVKKIESYAFDKCFNLNTVTIGSGIEKIMGRAFCSCNLLKFIITAEEPPIIFDNSIDSTDKHFKIFVPEDSLVKYKTDVNWKQFEKLIYPITDEDNDTIVKFVDKEVFSILLDHKVDRNLSNQITIEEIQSIRNVYSWFENSSISEFTEFRGFTNVSVLNDGAFANCHSLTDITLPESVTKISSKMFMGCESLTDISIHSGITEIGSYAYKKCTSLETVTIDNSITKIGTRAFDSCVNLKSLNISNETPPELGKNAFVNTNNDFKIYVPIDLVNEYKRRWSDYKDVIVPNVDIIEKGNAVGFFEDNTQEWYDINAEVGDLYLYRLPDDIDEYTHCVCTEVDDDTARFDTKVTDEIGSSYTIDQISYVLYRNKDGKLRWAEI